MDILGMKMEKIEFNQELYEKNLKDHDFSDKLQDLRSDTDKKEMEGK